MFQIVITSNVLNMCRSGMRMLDLGGLLDTYLLNQWSRWALNTCATSRAMLRSRFTSATARSMIHLRERIKIHIARELSLLRRATGIEYLSRDYVTRVQKFEGGSIARRCDTARVDMAGRRGGWSWRSKRIGTHNRYSHLCCLGLLLGSTDKSVSVLWRFQGRSVLGLLCNSRQKRWNH